MQCICTHACKEYLHHSIPVHVVYISYIYVFYPTVIVSAKIEPECKLAQFYSIPAMGQAIIVFIVSIVCPSTLRLS